MGVNVHCRQGAINSSEHTAALHLKDIFERDWDITPQVPETTACIDIHVSPIVLAAGNPVRQLDLFVAINCARYFASRAADRAGHPVIESLFIVIEVKGHPDSECIFYRDGEAAVKYGGNQLPSSATGQNFQQSTAIRKFLQDYLAKAHQGTRVPWISRVCWFTGVSSTQYPYNYLELPHQLVFSDLTVAELVTRAGIGPAKVSHLPDGRMLWNASETPAMCQILRRAWTEPAPPTKLDRKRINAIANEVASLAQNVDNEGTIFRGYGGTGKTFALLANAVHRYRQRGRVLVLTFNLVLTWELRRMISVMDAGFAGIIPHEDAGAPCITVETISSWVRQLASELGLVSDDVDLFPPDNRSFYRNLCMEVLEYLNSCRDKNDIRKNLKAAASYEWVFIDEAQDVPAHEKNLVTAVFGQTAFCVSDGLDQVFRAEAPTDWRRGPDGKIRSGVTTHRLDQCYRLKSNLCEFVNRFATAINLDSFKLNPAPNAAGGKVIIHFGSAEKALKDVFPLASQSNKNDGNSPSDILICTEKSLVHPVNITEEYLHQQNQKSWNGILPEEQLGHMASDQVRIVLLEDCRGLEGWCVFLLGLDKFYDQRLAQLETELSPGHPTDYKRLAADAVKKFITIPLTRAMDTLVIQVENRQSYLGSIFLGLHGDFIEHR